MPHERYRVRITYCDNITELSNLYAEILAHYGLDHLGDMSWDEGAAEVQIEHPEASRLMQQASDRWDELVTEMGV